MDFNPLDILAAAALGEKDGQSDLKSSKPGQASCSGQTEASESDSKDADDDSNKEMGKTTSNGLKHNHCAKDCEKTMAPQKMPWSPVTLMPDHLDGIDGKPEKFSLDELVQDIKKKSLDVQLKKIVDESISKDVDLQVSNNDDFISLKEAKQKSNNNVVLAKNAINEKTKAGSESKTLDSNLHEDTGSKMASVEDDQSDVMLDDSSCNPSDVDTVDSSDTKSPENEDPAFELLILESISLDHSYALAPGQTRPPPSLKEDDDIDVCSDNSPLPEETEQRSRNLSLDCSYLKFGILEGVSTSAYDLYKMSNVGLGHTKLQSSSTSSPIADLISKPTHVVANSDDSNDFTGTTSPSPRSAQTTSVHSHLKSTPKYGKFKIGTFASFSSGNLELEKYLKNKDHTNNRKLNIGIPPETHLINSSLSSPSSYTGVHPWLQSPSLDWDRSEAGSEAHDDSSDARTPHRLSPDFTTEKFTEWSHPIYHDHDYCTKESGSGISAVDTPKLNIEKRKYTKRKNKLEGLNHEKLMKAKYLKKELLRQDSFMKTSEPEVTQADPVVIKTNPVGRPRKRPLDKVIDEEMDPETGTKLKITGKFQDQYVYYLSKSSRTTTRRRQTPSLPSSSDKIIVPAPKPGDIVVPHLTDADIETVRLKGRSALNLPERPHMTNVMLQALSVPSSVHLSIPLSHHSSEFISDVDSHIVSTILSMENDNLASPTTSQAPDITSTAGLNPNQPALTESLRIMSGDPSITSEHVLNYLLSVVKDDSLLGSGSGFDSSSSSLFPSLPSDAIYTKADIGESSVVTQAGLSPMETNGQTPRSPGQLDIGKCILSSYSNTAALGTNHGSESDHYIHSTVKDPMDENVSLPDDLSSYMSNSQGTSSSNTTQDGDSHSSLKSMFGSDLSSLGAPQLSSSVPRLTSIEKTLDYLGVPDDDMKLDNVFTSKLDHDIESTQALTPVSTASADDTPWIVTVTLYFNDVPAIMINNQPYIRLVDIHKQILPAKDTGILKKRCQLLKIPVLNCSEMQRYFLVQYGRAYNSKSTLIVSKDQANHLVTYYATPQPRIGRTDEAHQRRPSSSGGSEGSTRSPVTHLPLGGVKKRGRNQRKVISSGTPESNNFGLTLQLPEKETAQMMDDDTCHSKRTRHKKINYLEMLKGEEKERSSDAAILETIESVARSSPDYFHNIRSSKKGLSKKKNKGNTTCDKTNHSKKRLSNVQIRKSSEKGPRSRKEQLGDIVQKVKGSRSKLGSDNKQWSERDTNMSSEVDSDDSIDMLQSKKFRPLKLKVNSLLNFAGQRKGSSPTKKGLFSRSNSATSSTSDRPVRVLAVAHQAAMSSNNAESHLPSQPAHIHLDLFVKSNSACVRCETCSQFLSVPHFMRHHHVPMDNEWLATEAAHRILVPRNKENISEQEKQLWEEFHRLQEAIGGFGETDDDTDTDEDVNDYNVEDDEDDDDNNSYDQSSVELSGASDSLISLGHSPLRSEVQEKGLPLMNSMTVSDEPSTADEAESDSSVESDEPSSSSHPTKERPQKLSNEALAKIGLVRREVDSAVTVGLLNGVKSAKIASNVRTSSRKRKSKQLFSIENYYTPKKSLNDDESSSSIAHREHYVGVKCE